MLLRVLLTAVLTAGLAAAQRGGDEGGGGMGGTGGMGGRGGETGMGEMGGGMRARPQSRFDRFSDKLRLNKDQRTEAETVLADAGKETLPVQQQLLKARQDLAGALISGAGPQAVDGLIKGYAPLSAQLAGIEARAFGKIYAMLKPNQQSKAAQAFPLLAEILEQPQVNGRGRQRGER